MIRRAGLGNSVSLEGVEAPLGVSATPLSPWRYANPCMIWFLTMRRSNYLKDVFHFSILDQSLKKQFDSKFSQTLKGQDANAAG